MNALIQEITIQVVAPIAVSVASALAIWILGELARWVRARSKNERVVSAIDRMCHTTASTVAELEQVLVPAIKKAGADGKLTPAERKYLKLQALARIKKRLAPAVHREARAAIGDVDSFLQAKIEQAVLEMKARAAGGA